MTNEKKSSVKFMGLIVAATLSLAACNTIAGVGEDAQSAGEAVEDAANGAK